MTKVIGSTKCKICGQTIRVLPGEYEEHMKLFHSEETKKSAEKTLQKISGVKFRKTNKNTPKTYEKCPNNIQMELFKRHSHAEIKNEIDPNMIVYSEKDVIELIYLAKQNKI